ncbi:unnamed protein product [Moneuplotes crassus]|uniref:Uncharacterized protein n=1 Tax=Euplotes crassus TaxID=5936 RepID=A0AAD1U2Z2_EUPCR|nr:unnamed protein product [Moneuplotes crassus]
MSSNSQKKEEKLTKSHTHKPAEAQKEPEQTSDDQKEYNLLDPEQLAAYIGFTPEQCISTVSQIDGVLAREDTEFRLKSRSKYMKLMQKKKFRISSHKNIPEMKNFHRRTMIFFLRKF